MGGPVTGSIVLRAGGLLVQGTQDDAAGEPRNGQSLSLCIKSSAITIANA